MVDAPSWDDTVPVANNATPSWDGTTPVQSSTAPGDHGWLAETKKAAGSAYDTMTAPLEMPHGGIFQEPELLKRGLAGVQLAASPLTGAIRSFGGRGLQAADEGMRSVAESVYGKDAVDQKSPRRPFEHFADEAERGAILAPGIGFGSRVAPAAAAAGKVNPIVSAADRISQASGTPVEVPRAFASDSAAVQRAGQIARNAPFIGDSIPKATGRMADQLDVAKNNIASNYGDGSGPNVANRVGQTLQNEATSEATSAAEAGTRSDDAILAAWQKYQDDAAAAINNRETQAANAARTATGQMSPQDMGQALIERLRAGEQEAEANKKALYKKADTVSASITRDSVKGVYDKTSKALSDAGWQIDPRTNPSAMQLTPASNAMMTELQNFSNLIMPNRLSGKTTWPEYGKMTTQQKKFIESVYEDETGLSAETPHDVPEWYQEQAEAKAAGKQTPLDRYLESPSISIKDVTQAMKRLGNLAQSATQPADKAAASIIMRNFYDWQTKAFDKALYSGSPDALKAIREANAANRKWRTSYYNDRDDADRIINKVISEEITPQQMANWIVGTGEVGAQGVSSRLLTRLGEITNNDPNTLNIIRSGVAHRLFGAEEGVTPKNAEATANQIYKFFNGSGRDVARKLYTPDQKKAALAYADIIRQSQEDRALVSKVAANTKPSQMPIGPGPMQKLAETVLGKKGKPDEALFATINSYAKSRARADIKTLSKILETIPEQQRGDLAGAIIRNLGKSSQTDGFSLDNFATAWKNDYTPQAKDLLFGNSGLHRKALDDIADISQRYKEIGRKFGNPSGTGQIVLGGAEFSALAALWHDPMAALYVIPSAVGAYTFAKLLSRPASAATTANLFKRILDTAKNTNPLQVAGLNATLKSFVSSANKLGSDVTVPQLLQGAQGPGTSNADEKRAKGGAVKHLMPPVPIPEVDLSSSDRLADDMISKAAQFAGASHFDAGGSVRKPGATYDTQLDPLDEFAYRQWVKDNNVPTDPDAKTPQDYDMRGFWKGLQQQNPRAQSAIDPNDSRMHYPDYWKTPQHQTFSNESQWAGPGAPQWTDDDKLVQGNGRVVFDDRNPPSEAEQLLSGRAYGGSVRGYADGGDPTDPSAEDLAGAAGRHLGVGQEMDDPSTFDPDTYKGSNPPTGTELLNPYLDQKQGIERGFVPAVKNAAKSAVGAVGDFANYTGKMAKDIATLPYNMYEHPEVTNRVINKLTGAYGEDREQTWPEKMIRSGASLPHEISTGELSNNAFDPVTGEIIPNPEVTERAQDLAGMAGGASLSSTTDATLGSTPFLRPALKYGDRIYKAPIKDPNKPVFFGAEHSDAIPPALQEDFHKKAMSGDDIDHYNFGFLNHKGQFLDRQGALDYGVREGLIDPRDAQYGVLTTSMLSDSGKSGAPLSALERAAVEKRLTDQQGGFTNLGVPEGRDPNTGAYIGQVPKFKGRDEAGRFQKAVDPYRNLPDINQETFGPPDTTKKPQLRQNGRFVTQADYFRNRVPTEDELTKIQQNEFYNDQNAPSMEVLNKALERLQADNPHVDPAAVEAWKAKMPFNTFSDTGEAAPLTALERSLRETRGENANLSRQAVDELTQKLRARYPDINNDAVDKWKDRMPLLSDSGKSGAPLSALEKSFYSQVEKTIQAAPQSKMHGVQWANWLKNQPGVKPEELQHTGLDQWLRSQNKPVTKQEVADFFDKKK